MSDSPLDGRPGLRTEAPATNRLAQEVGQLADRNGLRGCVLISFTEDRVGVNSSGEGEFARRMEDLGDGLLAAIDDGLFDPEEFPCNPLATRIERLAQKLYDLRDSAPSPNQALWIILDRHATALSKLGAKVEKAAKKDSSASNRRNQANPAEGSSSTTSNPECGK